MTGYAWDETPRTLRQQLEDALDAEILRNGNASLMDAMDIVSTALGLTPEYVEARVRELRPFDFDRPERDPDEAWVRSRGG